MEKKLIWKYRIKWFIGVTIVPFIVFVSSVIFLDGCTYKLVSHRCPTFDAKVKIHLTELNATHYAISKEDALKLEALGRAKSKFNEGVRRLNEEVGYKAILP